MQKKVIYISMETKIREYHAKLLLTLYALKRGYQVVFGSKYALNDRMKSAAKSGHSLPVGVFVGTGVTKALGADLIDAKAYGHRTVSFDEEGLAYINPDVFMETRIKEEIIREIDHLFTWGGRHSELVHKKAPQLTNYSAVGNMRFELLKEKYRSIYDGRVKELRDKYGDFILINTNLKVFNHVVGEKRLFESMRETTFIQSGEDEAFYKDRYDHQKETFDSYRSLVSMLAPRIKPMNIVIRPHTSENMDTWRALEAPNVFVETSGGVIPWILASKAVIQKNCTTSTETVYLGKPVITYSVTHDPRFDNEITKGIGKFCRTEDEVWDALQNLDAFEGQLQADREYLAGYVSNMELGENVADAILDVLDGLELPSVDESVTVFKKGLNFKHYLKQCAKSVIAAFKRNSPDVKLRKQKFPGLTINELAGDIGRFAQTIEMQSESVQVNKIVDDLYHFNIV